jgi:hypothetical protein
MTPKRHVTFSRHARLRMAQRGIDEDDVLVILSRGLHEAADDRLKKSTATLRNRSASVVYNDDAADLLVITVMWVDE